MGLERDFIINVVVGIVCSTLLLYGMWTMYQDHNNLNALVNWANGEIHKQQAVKTQAVVPQK